MGEFTLVKTIAIDFDGVIHKYSKGWQDGVIYDDLMDDAKEVIDELTKKGFKCVVFTARESLLPVKEWLITHKLDLPVTNKKPPAIAYIDDRGIRFTNWKDIKNYFI